MNNTTTTEATNTTAVTTEIETVIHANEATVEDTKSIDEQTITVEEKIIETKQDTTKQKKQPKSKKTKASGPWIDAMKTPTLSKEEIKEIREAHRGELLMAYHPDVADAFIDENKMLSSMPLLVDGKFHTIDSLLMDSFRTNTSDNIQKQFTDVGTLKHSVMFDATYTTSLRGGEVYDIVFTVDSIVKLLEDGYTNHPFEKIAQVVEALKRRIPISDISAEDVRAIAKALFEFKFLENAFEFVKEVSAKRRELSSIKQYNNPRTINKAFELLKDYAVLNNQGKIQIINTTKEGLVTSTESGLKTLFKNKLVEGINPVDIWMHHEDRPLYIDTKFDPSFKSKDDKYNLFKGYKHSAQKLIDIALFKNFVRDIICSSDDKMYNIVWSFLAQMLQDPTRKMGTALVLLSGKGTGKSTFVKVIGELLKGYFFQSADNKRLLGEFNSHLENTLLFYANELTFTDNKRVIAKLKNVITEKNFTYEAKGGATYSAPNLVRVIIDSNEDMAVAQTADERRFIYPMISDEKVGDTEYFNELHALFETEGFYESLMDDLMHYDYQPWEHYLKTPPKNEVTEEQVLENFSDVESFWMYCLEEGHIPYVPYEVTYDDMLNITNESLYQSYVKHTRANGRRVTLDSANFGKAMKKHILKDSDLDKKGKITVNGVRKNSRLYDTRDNCAKHFSTLKRLNNMDYDGAAWEVCVNS